MKQSLLAAAGCALLLVNGALPTLAADLGRPNSEPQYQANEPLERWNPSIWQGVYYGLSAGYGWGDSEHNYDRNANHGLATKELEGALGSLTIGYNYLATPGFLIGVEGDLGFMDLRSDDQTIFDGHVWKAQFGGLWGTVRGRTGFVWNRALIYGTGGAAFMQVNEVGYGDAAGQTATNTDYRAGWVVGGGVEYALTSTMTAKFEYLHMDFGRYNGLSENQETYHFDNTVDIVRAGMNFKF